MTTVHFPNQIFGYPVNINLSNENSCMGGSVIILPHLSQYQQTLADMADNAMGRATFCERRSH